MILALLGHAAVKKLYWRPPGVSRRALVLVSVVALLSLVVIEAFPVQRKQGQYGAKVSAARLAQKCMEAIKTEKQRRGIAIDPKVDPARTGLIGEAITPVTSNTGFLEAKLTTTNPNFAAVIVHLLDKAGVREGDLVAVGVSGSFPALNVSTYAALGTLKLRPIVIASTSSSEWGANHVRYLWLDMEKTLRDQQLIAFQTAGASYGGIDDIGLGITQVGRALLEAAMQRNGVKKLEAATLEEAIAQRVALFDELAGDAPIKAYVNVGGGSASVGTHVGKKQFKPGLNTSPPRGADVADSVMLRFAKRGIPVIHISRIKLLAERYGLPYAPKKPVPLGQGKVFTNVDYNRWLALVSLVLILVVMFGFVRGDLGRRMLSGMKGPTKTKVPEQMV